MDNVKEKKELLIVDNGPDCRELCRLLDDEYSLSVERDGKEAIAVIREGRKDIKALLINADLQEDLCAAVEFIKSSIRFSSIPILLFGDGNVSPDALKYLGNGVVDYIAKPYNGRIIINRIENAIIFRDSLNFCGVEKILKQLPSNIYLKDNEGRYIFATKYRNHLKKPDEPGWTIRGKTDPEIRRDKENAEKALKKDLEIIRTGKGASYTIEINDDGVQEFFQIIKQPVFNDDGRITGIIGLINDVTEFELLKRKLKEKAVTDEMTGLYNRAYFEEFIGTHGMDDYPLGIISADCDGLKEINDTYGHMTGDEYIKAAVSLFKAVLPPESIIFRMGGDEFVIILPGSSEETVMAAAEQIRRKQKLFRVGEQQLSISVGISVMNGKEDCFDKCLAESDRNMYAEKKKRKSGKQED